MFPDIENDRCVECGRLRVVGDWPRCPHGPVSQPGADGHTTTYQDTIPGGMILENYGPHPIRVDSHTERRKIMERGGLQLRERYSPAPGTDKDPAGIPNPAGYMDPVTLENARILIERAQRGKTAEPEPIHVTHLRGTISQKEAIDIQHEVNRARRSSSK